MSEYEAGEIFARVVPSFAGIRQQIEREAQVWNDIIRKAVEPALPDALRAGARNISQQGSRAGSDYAGAFAKMVRDRVDAAFKALPKAKPGVDATELDAELEDIRAKLAALGDVRIGVDLSAEEALAEVDRLQARLTELGQRSPNIQVRADTADAAAQLAAIQAEVSKLDGETARVNVDTSSATSAVSGLTLAAIGLGPALVPIGAAATAGLAGIATVAASGAAGIGVLALAFSGVTGALQDLAAAHQQTARTATTSAQSQANAARQVQSAEAALANTRQTADDAAVRSAEAVANARRNVADVERQVAQAQVTAARQVTDAQYQLTQANIAAATAQERLNTAREQAARDLEDAANRQADALLAVQQDQIALIEAQQRATAVNADATATDLDRQQAALDVAEAQQRLLEAQQEVTRATQDNNAAQAEGVNGAPAVVAAAQEVTDAHHNQTKARQSLQAAITAQTRAEHDGAQKTAAAQRQLGDAIRAQQEQTRQSAYSVASAQRAVAAALDAQTVAAAPSNAALAKAHAALAALSPAGRQFVTFVSGTLKPALTALRNVAQQNLLPGLETGIKAAMPLLPAFTDFVGGLARTMGDLFTEAGRALNSPFWRQFFGYVEATAGPTLSLFAHVLGNLAKGFAGLLEAFAPVVVQLGKGILHLSQRFADFGAHAGKNSAFQSFLDYIKANGPKIVDTFAALGRAVGKIAQALAPIGPKVLGALTDVFDAITAIPTPVLTALAVAIAAVTAAMKASALFGKMQTAISGLVAGYVRLTGATAEAAAAEDGLAAASTEADAAMDANPIGAIVLALEALGLGAYELAKHWSAVWGAITDVATAAWDAITSVTSTAWNAITGAFSSAWSWIRGFVSAHWPLLLGMVAGPIGLAVGEIVKHWSAVETAFSNAWGWVKNTWSTLWGGAKAIVTAPIDAAKDVVQGLFGKDGPIRGAFGAVWDWLNNTWSTIWGGLKGIVTAPINAARDVIDTVLNTGHNSMQTVFSTAVKAIRAVWDGLKAIAKAPIRFIVQTVLNDGLIAAWDWIIDKLHLGGSLHIPDFPLPQGFASGGVIPGYAPGVDSVLAMVSPGESILRPEVTRWLGADSITAMNTAAMRGQLPRFATGVANFDPNPINVIKRIGSGVASAAGAAWGGVKTLAEALADPVGWLMSAFTKPLDALKQIAGGPFGDILTAIPHKLVSYIIDKAKSLIGFGGSATVNTGASGPAAAAAQTIARNLLPTFGWDGSQMPPLLTLWNNESGWMWNATNGDSGAYGIPQALPASKMASAGADWRTNPGTQILWGLRDYIKPRYGSPEAALAFWNRTDPRPIAGHWYDDGGFLPPGVSVAINGTGRPEPVFTSAQLAMLGGGDAAGIGPKLDRLANLLEENPERTGDEIGSRFERAAVEHARTVTRVVRKG
jgi:phage-related protein